VAMIINNFENITKSYDFDCFDLDGEKTFVEYWQNGSNKNVNLLFIPGFMTQSSAKDDWHEPICAIARQWSLNAYALRWNSGKLVTSLLGALLNPSAIMFDFMEKKKVADSISAMLDEHIRIVPGNVIIIGHSLGARMALNHYIRTNDSNKVKGVFALAPAIGRDFVPKSRKTKPFVFYSHDDDVLKAFSLIEDDPLGLVGPNAFSGMMGIDVSHLTGHLGYSTQLRRLFSIDWVDEYMTELSNGIF